MAPRPIIRIGSHYNLEDQVTHPRNQESTTTRFQGVDQGKPWGSGSEVKGWGMNGRLTAESMWTGGTPLRDDIQYSPDREYLENKCDSVAGVHFTVRPVMAVCLLNIYRHCFLSLFPKPGVSNPWLEGHTWPRMAMNAA